MTGNLHTVCAGNSFPVFDEFRRRRLLTCTRVMELSGPCRQPQRLALH